MADNVQGGFGFTCNITINAVPTAIARVVNMGIPEFEKIVTELTGHDAPGGYAQYVSTRKRKLNEFTLTLGWDATDETHAALVAGYDSEDPVALEIIDPEGIESIAFDAHITKLGRVSEQEEGYTCDVTVQPTGNPTVTVESSGS